MAAILSAYTHLTRRALVLALAFILSIGAFAVFVASPANAVKYTLSQFVKAHAGERTGDGFSNSYRGECVSLVKLYYKEVQGGTTAFSIPSGVASGLYLDWNHSNLAPLRAKFTRYAKKDISYIEPGDILVWNHNKTYTAGHTAVATARRAVNSKTYKAFEQNPMPATDHEVSANQLGGFLGVLRPKTSAAPTSPYYSAQLSRSTPAGHTRDADITFKFSVKNPTKKDVKTKSIHVVIRDAEGKSHNAAWKTNYTLKAGKTTTVSVKKRFPSTGTYRAWPTWLGTDGKYHDGNVVTFDIWQPTITSGKWYTMTNRSSGMLVDVAGAKTANGTRVQQVKANGNRAQKWKFIATSDGYYTVMTGVSPSKGLDVKSHSTKNRAAIQIWTVENANAVAGRNQQWKPVWTAGGGFVLIPRHATGMRLDVPDGKAKDGLKLQLYKAATGNLNQRFNIWETTY